MFYRILLLGWDAVDQIEQQYNALPENTPSELRISLQNFLDEHKLPVEETIKKYQATFNEHRTIENWREVLNLYIRHELFDYADEWYKELFTENFDLIQDNQEPYYHDYMVYIVSYQRDLKNALRCYVDVKEKMKDSDLSGFWELELMAISNTFNNPERFEEERWPFVEKGLIPVEEYHRAAFIAYFANLNEQKTYEHHCYMQEMLERTGYPPLLVLPNYEVEYMCLKGRMLPTPEAMAQGINDQTISNMKYQYQNEEWHKEIPVKVQNRFTVNSAVCMDSWALLYLFYNNTLQALLETKDIIYVTHLSVIRLLDELANSNNECIRQLINFMTVSDTIKLQSPNFQSQLTVRDVIPYTEPASTIALSRELECAPVIGAPEINDAFVSHFKNEFVRVSDVDQLIAQKGGN